MVWLHILLPLHRLFLQIILMLVVTAWINDDGRVKTAIVTSVKPSFMMSLAPFQTAKEMWDYLKKRFVQVSGAHLHTLMQGLRGLQ